MKEHFHVRMVNLTEPHRRVEWQVFAKNGPLPGLSFPDTSEGEGTARLIASHLNLAYRAGANNVRAALRIAMRDD